jgi:LacI family transcriptional regulator, galactose operon repressor
VDGLLAVPTVDIPPLLRQAVDSGAPVVLIDREVPTLAAPVVRSDNATAVADLVDHLVALGHERVAIIAGPQELTTGRQRLDVFRTALSDHRLELPEAYVRVGDFQEASGRTAMAALLDLPQPPSVVFAADNLMGLGALAVLRDRALRVPDDVGLAVFDDVPWFPYLDPPVTAIAQEVVLMGRLAVRMLLDRINGRPVESVLLPTRLVVRASCGEPRATRDEARATRDEARATRDEAGS